MPRVPANPLYAIPLSSFLDRSVRLLPCNSTRQHTLMQPRYGIQGGKYGAFLPAR